MMRCLFLVLGEHKPSTRLRILPLCDALSKRGHQVTVRSIASANFADRLAWLRAARRHDFLLVQKKLFAPSFVALLRRANPHIFFDVDDAVMFHELERGEPLSGKFFKRFFVIAATSQHVVAGNHFIAEFAHAARPAGGVSVLPTPIDVNRLRAKTDYRAHEEIVIGWIGTKGNLQQLFSLASVFSDLARAFPRLKLRIIADATLSIPGVEVECKPWRAAEENADLLSFDIGIMPLNDTLWTRGKGGYKLLQYMAAGIPAVASPVGINREIIREGENGMLAATPDEWLASLRSLIENDALRERLGRAARTTVEREYGLESYLERYIALFEASYA